MPDDGDANELTVASVASSATSVTLLAANGLRAGWKVHNNSTAALYINETGAAATTSIGGYTLKVAADGYYESWPGLFVAGKITAIWASANGGASVSDSADTGNWDTGNTSAAPTSVVPPDPNASSPGAASSGLLESLAPLILGGAPLAAILGRRAMDMRPPAAEAPGASLLRLPAPEAPLQVGGPAPVAQLSGPGAQAQVEGARAGTPQLAAPGEAPAIKLPAVPTGNPTIPLPDSGPTPRATPETTPKGPGFDTEYAPSPVKDAIDKALPADEPAPPRAKTRAKPKAKIRIRA